MSVHMFNKTTGASKVNFLDEHVDNVISEVNIFFVIKPTILISILIVFN